MQTADRQIVFAAQETIAMSLRTGRTTAAIRVHEIGGPDKLIFEEIDVPALGENEVLVRNEAIGLNFLDVYMRSGRYPHPLPFTPGHEGAGTVGAIGSRVHSVSVGDRVGYIDPMGAYALHVVRPADRLIRLRDEIDARRAAAMLLKGMTAEYLVRRTYAVRAGETILVHAAAGGVGQILCQWASFLGATVIGTVGSDSKRAVAEAAGCAHVIVGSDNGLADMVRDLTGGEGVSAVYDGIGGNMFSRSLDCLRPRGMMVAFGAASGPIPPFDVQSLGPKGSLYLTRPMLGPYVATSADLQSSADALFDVVTKGHVRVNVGATYDLSQASAAHSDLEQRKLTGSTILLP